MELPRKLRKERDYYASLGLYWCPLCKTYKIACEMQRRSRKTSAYGYGPYCLICDGSRRSMPEEKEKKHTYNHQYHLLHAKELNEYGVEWRRRNPEYTKAYETKRARTEEKRLRDKKYRDSLPISERRRRAKKHYESRKKYQLAYNKAKYNTEEGKRKRRVWRLCYTYRKLGVTCDFTVSQWEAALKRWNFKCAYCGERTATDQDHFVPVSLGGGYTASNIVPACDHCNSSKRNLTIEDWADYEGIRQERIEVIRLWLSERNATV